MSLESLAHERLAFERLAQVAQAVTLRDSGKLRWYAGMLTMTHGRVEYKRPNADLGIDEPEQMVIANPAWGRDLFVSRWLPVPARALPDFTDPLTCLALLPMAQDVWEDPSIYVLRVFRDRDIWACRSTDYGTPYTRIHASQNDPHYPTRQGALFAAILAAPRKP